MSEDTISRQAVIKINQSYHGQMPNEVNHRIWKEINELPSAQPDSKELSGTHKALDTISRQAAMEAVRELYIQSPKISNDIVYDMAIDQAHDALVNLPSAQPDLSEYSDKLWKKAYERGKAEALAQLEEAYISGETEAEARYHAQQRWIPCSDCERRCDKWEHSKTSRE